MDLLAILVKFSNLDPLGFKIGASVTDSTQLITLNFGETPFTYEPPEWI